MVATCWGPALGAKVLTYRTTVILGVLCQTVGAMGFGIDTAHIFSGYLDKWTILQPHPVTTMYTLMWVSLISAIWQAISVWRRVLVPTHLALGTTWAWLCVCMCMHPVTRPSIVCISPTQCHYWLSAMIHSHCNCVFTSLCTYSCYLVLHSTPVVLPFIC